MRLLLDTSVLIDALRNRNRRRELLAELIRAGHDLTTSVLNVAEIYAGMRSGEETHTENFINELECCELTRETAEVAGKLKNYWARKGRTLALADVIVAAIALENGCVLMTDNGKDFPMADLRQYPLPR